jgi:hypothetical protein
MFADPQQDVLDHHGLGCFLPRIKLQASCYDERDHMMRTMSTAQKDETASAAETFPVHENVIGASRAVFVQRTRQEKRANEVGGRIVLGRGIV